MLVVFKRASAGALILALGGLIVPHVAFADATQIIVRCALAAACSSTKNTLGAGIQGIAAGANGSNAGVRGLDGTTNGGQNIGVLGSTSNGGYGVEGTSGNGAHGGVLGSATTGTGTEGDSNSNFGVRGQSNTAVGVGGESVTGAGVQGVSESGDGVMGVSHTSGSGVAGFSNGGIGVVGYTSGKTAGYFEAASTGTSVEAVSGTGYGLLASTGGDYGAFISSSEPMSGNGAIIQGSHIGLLARSDSFPLVLRNLADVTQLYVDAQGNVHSQGTFQPFARTRSGQEANGYSTTTTTPNVEDVGSAELINGAASVRFDPAFAASIDLQTAYQVFLTPGGDTRGLFVATKTANGFVVRETQGGRGHLSFDYRIVARALGHARDRMAFVNPQNDGRPKSPAIVNRPHPATHIPAVQFPLKNERR